MKTYKMTHTQICAAFFGPQATVASGAYKGYCDKTCMFDKLDVSNGLGACNIYVTKYSMKCADYFAVGKQYAAHCDLRCGYCGSIHDPGGARRWRLPPTRAPTRRHEGTPKAAAEPRRCCRQELYVLPEHDRRHPSRRRGIQLRDNISAVQLQSPDTPPQRVLQLNVQSRHEQASGRLGRL